MPFLLAFSMTVIITLFTSCDNNDDDVTSSGAPVITQIRNYAASPNDTLVDKIVPGQWIVITGKNLANALEILIDGVTISYDPGLLSDTYAVVQVPYEIPFPSVPESQLNTIKYTTKGGQIIFPFDIVPGPPTIAGVSNENPVEGDVVTIFGGNLFLTNELVFGGIEITDFTEVDNGTSISFIMPNITTSGPVSITTESGTFSTVFNVNIYATDVLCNFDDVNTFAWGTGLSNDSVEFPGNHGYFPVLNSPVLSPGDGAWWGWERSINLNSMQWVPTADLGLDVSQFALKFEINVPGDWNGTSIIVLKDYTWGQDGYVLRYEPWKVSGNKTVDATTEGKWVTVTIPLTEFRKKRVNTTDKDGEGDSATTLTQLLGESGNGSMLIYTINEGSEAIAFRGAIDNIRIAKIKE